LAKTACDKALARFDKIRNANGSRSTSDIRLDMQKIMQTKAAVFRTQSTLDEGIQAMAEVKKTFAMLGCR
jgi:succinate dehydrogenase / fumarate reductase flavoprotein subunit